VPDDVFVADLVKRGDLPLSRIKLDAAGLAAPAAVAEHEHALVVKRANLLNDSPMCIPSAESSPATLAIAARPFQVPGVGPPAMTYSISGCAHSAEP